MIQNRKINIVPWLLIILVLSYGCSKRSDQDRQDEPKPKAETQNDQSALVQNTPALEEIKPKAPSKTEEPLSLDISKIEDQKILGDIAVNDKDAHQRKAALERLTDFKVLCGVFANTSDESIRDSAFKRINRYVDYAIGEFNELPREILIKVLDRISDQYLLARIAISNKDPFLREQVVSRISKEEPRDIILKTEGADESLKIGLVKSLTDQQNLLQIAVSDYSDPIRIHAIRKITDKESLTQIIESTQSKEVKDAALSKKFGLTSYYDFDILMTARASYDKGSKRVSDMLKQALNARSHLEKLPSFFQYKYEARKDDEKYHMYPIVKHIVIPPGLWAESKKQADSTYLIYLENDQLKAMSVQGKIFDPSSIQYDHDILTQAREALETFIHPDLRNTLLGGAVMVVSPDIIARGDSYLSEVSRQFYVQLCKYLDQDRRISLVRHASKPIYMYYRRTLIGEPIGYQQISIAAMILDHPIDPEYEPIVYHGEPTTVNEVTETHSEGFRITLANGKDFKNILATTVTEQFGFNTIKNGDIIGLIGYTVEDGSLLQKLSKEPPKLKEGILDQNARHHILETLLTKYPLEIVNASYEDWPTPFNIALSEGDAKSALVLIKAGLDVNTTNERGETALHLAAKNNLNDTLEQLIKLNADMNIQNKQGDTPLHETLVRHHNSTAEILIRNKADVMISNNYDVTSLELMNVLNEPELMNILNETSTSIETITSKKQSYAALILSTYLIDYNGDWEKETLNFGKKVYQKIKSMPQEDIIDALAKGVLIEKIRNRVLIMVIKLGIKNSQQKLVEVLFEHGDKAMANDYLNAGSQVLKEGAEKWARENGFYIKSVPGSSPVKWGEF